MDIVWLAAPLGAALHPHFQGQQVPVSIPDFLSIFVPVALVVLLAVYLAARKWWRLIAAALASVLVFTVVALAVYQDVPTWVGSLNQVQHGAIALLAGLAASLFLVWGGLFMLASACALGVLNLTELTGDAWFRVSFWMFLDLLNVGMKYQIVEDGKVALLKPQGIMPKMGKGLLVVRPGNAVITERGGNVTQIVGPGLHKTAWLEQIRHIVDLKPQRGRIDFQKIPTRDGALLAGRLEYTYHLQHGAPALPPLPSTPAPSILPGPHDVASSTVSRAIYLSDDRQWQRQTRDAIETALTRVIGQLQLAQIFDDPWAAPSPVGGVSTLAPAVQAAANDLAQEWGVVITTVRFLELPVPESLQDHVITRWQTHRAEQLHEVELEARKDFLTQQTGTRDEIFDGLQDLLTTLSGGAVSDQTQQQLLQTLAIVLTASVRDQQSALKYLTVLETLSKNPSVQVVIQEGEGSPRLLLG